MVIAEFTTNAFGHFGLLERMTYAAKAAGATHIKMQAKDVESFYSPEKLRSPYASPFGRTYRDYRTMFEFNRREWEAFNVLCNDLNLEWYATAQDSPSLDFLLGYDLSLYKVASVNARNADLLAEIRDKVPVDRTIVISVAGCTVDEIEAGIRSFPDHPLIIQHCVAEYPCPWENLKLGNIPFLIERFADDRIQIGYSGHEQGILPSLAAYSMGATTVERHFCMSREGFVHHLDCALTPDEFRTLSGLLEIDVPLEPFYRGLIPDEAYESRFGMSAVEESFLVNHTYGGVR